MAKRAPQPASLATSTQVEKETIPWVKLFMNAGSTIKQELGILSFLFTEHFLSNSYTCQDTNTYTYTHRHTCMHVHRHTCAPQVMRNGVKEFLVETGVLFSVGRQWSLTTCWTLREPSDFRVLSVQRRHKRIWLVDPLSPISPLHCKIDGMVASPQRIPRVWGWFKETVTELENRATVGVTRSPCRF